MRKKQIYKTLKAGNGVGDDENSWAYDGSRQQKWHGGSEYYGQYWSSGKLIPSTLFCFSLLFFEFVLSFLYLFLLIPLLKGDIIGCAVDLDNKKMNFFRNGSDMGVAYEGFNFGDGLSPAASFSNGQSMTFNFGKTTFRYPHPNSEFKMLHCFLTEEELANLTKVFNNYKGTLPFAEYIGASMLIYTPPFPFSYAAVGVSLSESGETGDVIKGQGLLEYGKELGVVEDTDPGLLLLLWKLGSTIHWELSREEFVGGWTTSGFVEEATTVWSMLSMDKQWALWPKFNAYMEAAKVKSVSKDTWRQFYDFMKVHPTSLDNYDEGGNAKAFGLSFSSPSHTKCRILACADRRVRGVVEDWQGRHG